MKYRPIKPNHKMRSRARGDIELHYKGPIRLNTQGLDARITRANLDVAFVTSSSPGGIINGAYGTSDITACSDWSGFATVHQEYRVVAMQLKWQPRFNNTSTAGTLPGYGAGAVWHTPTVPTPTSIDGVVQNATYKTLNTGYINTLTYRARGTEEMAWIPTTATSTHGGCNYYLQGCSPSETYGVWFITYTVEFRGRK